MPIKVLMLHNYYQQRGGEDSVFEAEVQLLQKYGDSVQTLQFHNNTVLDNPFHKLKAGLQGIYNPSSAQQLEKKIKDFKPDILHAHNFFPIASPVVFKVAKRHNIPVVMTLHNFRLVCPNALLYRQEKPCETCISKAFPIPGVLNACYRRSKLQTAAVAAMSFIHKLLGTWKQDIRRYIVLNDFAKKKFLASTLKLQAEQLAVKPNFIFDPIAAGDIIPDSVRGEYFIYIGRLSPEKGIKYLLEAFNTMEYPLKIVGHGPLEQEVQQAAKQTKNIEYLGFQEKKEVIQLVAGAKALILPSTCYENFPMSVLDAFSLGTPVITSRIGALPDIVQDAFTGFIASPGNSQDLQTQCKKVMLLPHSKYKALCQNARETYLKLYTPEVNYKRLMEIYDEALSSPSPSP